VLDHKPIFFGLVSTDEGPGAGMPAGVVGLLDGEDEIRGRIEGGLLFALPAHHEANVWVVVVTTAALNRHERMAVRSLVLSWSSAHEASKSAAIAAAHLAERQWTRALVESEKRQRALLENSATITAILSEDQTISYVSQPIASILGYPPNSAVGTLMAHFIADGESVTRWHQAWERCLHTGAALDEIRFRHRNGAHRILEVILNDHRASDMMNGVVVNARDISETRKLEEQVGRDDVTMALNRKAFLSFLREEPCDVLVVTVNDWRVLSRATSTEHADLVLLTIVDRLRLAVRTGDKVARLEGATFAIGLRCAPPLAIDSVVTRLRSAIAQPILTGDRTFVLEAAVGHAPHEAIPTEMLEHALLALAEAVSSKADFETYRSATAAAYELELDMWSRLGQALEAGEFELHYQPIVDLGSATVTGVEALVRWRHPVRGMIPPVEFVPIAEAHPALMTQLGDWIIDTAANQAAAWLSQGMVSRSFSISINVSGAQIETKLVGRLAAAVAANNLPAAMLTIEITETLLSENRDLEASVLDELRRAGHRLAIDDFGTGSANLARLGELRPDVVKLDRSLIAPIETDQNALDLFHKSIEIAHALGSKVTVEGIETIGQATKARDLGCEFGQGFFFARPAPPSDRTLSIVTPIGS
jgi:PAS domain S-box-containing protein